MKLTDLYLPDEELLDFLKIKSARIRAKYIRNASANHAVKKVLEWGNEWCETHRSIERDCEQGIIRKCQCFECWHELEKLVEGKKLTLTAKSKGIKRGGQYDLKVALL